MSELQFKMDMREFYRRSEEKTCCLPKCLCEPAHLYVWDEPLNYIDVYSRMQIEELIKEFAPTMLLVEHDVTFRDQIATKIVEV